MSYKKYKKSNNYHKTSTYTESTLKNIKPIIYKILLEILTSNVIEYSYDMIQYIIKIFISNY